MAKNPPIAPATNTSPMTESLGGFSPALPPMTFDEPAPEPEEPDEESWFSSFFDDDDDKDEPTVSPGDQLHLSSKDLPGRWRSADKAVDPDAVRSIIAKTHSDIPVEEIERQVEEESGLVEIAKGAYSMAEPAVAAAKSAYSTYTPEIVKPVIDKTVQAGGILLGSLEYGDVPRSETWTHAYLAGSFLPDTDTRFGDALGDLTGKGLRYFEQFKDLKDFVDGAEFDSEKQEDDYYNQIEALGKNIYSAFADAKLYDKAINTKGFFIDRPDWWGVLRGGNATGQDLLDIAFPIDMMKRLESNAPKVKQKLRARIYGMDD